MTDVLTNKDIQNIMWFYNRDSEYDLMFKSDFMRLKEVFKDQEPPKYDKTWKVSNAVLDFIDEYWFTYYCYVCYSDAKIFPKADSELNKKLLKAKEYLSLLITRRWVDSN